MKRVSIPNRKRRKKECWI